MKVGGGQLGMVRRDRSGVSGLGGGLLSVPFSAVGWVFARGATGTCTSKNPRHSLFHECESGNLSRLVLSSAASAHALLLTA